MPWMWSLRSRNLPSHGTKPNTANHRPKINLKLIYTRLQAPVPHLVHAATPSEEIWDRAGEAEKHTTLKAARRGRAADPRAAQFLEHFDLSSAAPLGHPNMGFPTRPS